MPETTIFQANSRKLERKIAAFHEFIFILSCGTELSEYTRRIRRGREVHAVLLQRAKRTSMRGMHADGYDRSLPEMLPWEGEAATAERFSHVYPM
jgi:hypothetical protein